MISHAMTSHAAHVMPTGLAGPSDAEALAAHIMPTGLAAPSAVEGRTS